MRPIQQLFALHYLFTNKGGRMIAHCLDLDLVAVGKDLETAQRRLDAIVRAQIETAYSTDNMALLFFRAPFDKYWKKIKTAQTLPPTTLVVEMPPMVFPVTQSITAEVPVWRAELTAAAA
jgi:hypothetical protein